MPSIEKMKTLIALNEEGSLSKAAKKLHISQSSLSREMKSLEDELGISIFVRTKNSISLNDSGQRILECAYGIDRIHERMMGIAKDIKESSSSLRIGLSAPGPYFRYPWLFAPNSNKRVSSSIMGEEEIIEGISQGSLDLGFLPHQVEGLECLYCFREHLFLYILKSHFLSSQSQGVYFKDADGQSFLLAEDLGSWEKIVEAKLPSSSFYHQRSDVLRGMIRASDLPGFVTDVVSSNPSDGDRVAIPILDEEAYMDFYLAYRKGNKEMASLIKENKARLS